MKRFFPLTDTHYRLAPLALAEDATLNAARGYRANGVINSQDPDIHTDRTQFINQLTLQDGVPGRMQMFLWIPPGGLASDVVNASAALTGRKASFPAASGLRPIDEPADMVRADAEGEPDQHCSLGLDAPASPACQNTDIDLDGQLQPSDNKLYWRSTEKAWLPDRITVWTWGGETGERQTWKPLVRSSTRPYKTLSLHPISTPGWLPARRGL